MDSDDYYRARFNTKLSEEHEAKYQAWVKEQSKRAGRDLSMDEIDYDLRGDWAQGASRDERGHGTDKFKKPNHPTFSNESVYHGAKNEDGEVMDGGRWEWDEDGNPVAFKQGETNKKLWPEWAIRHYLEKAEKGVKLKKE